MRAWLLRSRWWIVGAGIPVLLGGLLWAFWPKPEAPRQRVYQDFDVCLLADAEGIAGNQAGPVWAGLGDVSVATHVRTSVLAADDVRDRQADLASANTLARRHCAVIVAVGEGPIAAVQNIATQFPQVRFIVINGGTSADNVSRVDGAPGEALRASVRSTVQPLVPEFSS